MQASLDTRPGLQRALLVDAVATGATGLLLALAAGPLVSLLGLPLALMRWAGVALVPFAALLAALALRSRIPRGVVRAIVIVNALWAIDSVLLLATGWVSPTALGTAFVVAQAAVVAGFAWLEHRAMRTSGRA